MRFKKVGIQAVKPFLSRTKTVGNTTCIAKIIFVVGSIARPHITKNTIQKLVVE
jgi:hypothetical protein